jgi:hypothetical protein
MENASALMRHRPIATCTSLHGGIGLLKGSGKDGHMRIRADYLVHSHYSTIVNACSCDNDLIGWVFVKFSWQPRSFNRNSG